LPPLRPATVAMDIAPKDICLRIFFMCHFPSS
jgi:hypothetical protein